MHIFKKTCTLCAVLICYSIYANAQKTAQPALPLSSMAMTSVLSPAPNSFEMTRYSGLPVSLSTGSVNLSIPLGDVKAGKVGVPVSLSYSSGNGILLSQNASRTGMSWVLNAGGVITRSVYGNADESNPWITPPADITQTTQEAFDYLQNASNTPTGFDTQVDIFNFNFNGYDGKFYLDPADRTKIIFITASNLKIETNFHSEFSGDWTFRVIDPTGTKYLFGGSGATETSNTNPTGVGTSCGRNYLSPIPNAWYLKSIQRYTGEYVSFKYHPAQYSYFADVSQTIKIEATSITSPCQPGDVCPSGAGSNICLSDLVANGVMLESIDSKFERVAFRYASRTDLLGDSLLASVKFYKKSVTDSTKIDTGAYNSYNLNYVNANNTGFYNPYGNSSILSIRPFLTSVTRTAPGMAAQTHTMDYYNINGLPSRLSFAQDYWGYFNGVSNSNLVPPANDPALASAFPGGLANREPDSRYVHYGLLSKITYPTKGSDTLIYEPNTVWDNRIVLPPRTPVHKTATGTGTSTVGTTAFTFYSYTSQNITFNFATTYSGTGLDDHIHQHLIVDITTSGGINIYHDQFNIGTTYSKLLLLGTGNYTITLQAYGEATVGTVDFTYQQNGSPVAKNYLAGGVRLAKNITRPLIGNPLVKKYVYASLDAQAQSSGKLRALPNPDKYYSTMMQGTYCTTTDSAQLENRVQVCIYPVAYSNPANSLNYATGGHICYHSVIELKDSLWANGGIEHRYQFANLGINAFQERGTVIPGSPLSNFDFPPGLDSLTQTFVTTGNTSGIYQYRVINKTLTHYKIDTRKYRQQMNYIVRRSYPPRTIYSPPRDDMFYPFDVMGYYTVAQWMYPDTVTSTVYDLAGANPVTTIRTDLYRDTTNLMLSETDTKGSDGIAQQYIYKYPSDMVAAGTTVPYQAMINDNIIEPVIEHQYWKGGAMQEALRTNYGDFGNHVFEPDSIQSNTRGSYDTRINYYNYNSSGGLLSESKTRGPKNSYIWAYNNMYPVAEAKNALTSEIFYQGFEFLTTGVVTTSHTGNQGHFGSYTVSFSPPAGKSYVISWYQKNGAVWDYHKETYNGTSKAFTGSIYIDDIAIYPADAQMTLLNINPVTGLTAMMDAKGETTFYEYDNYQRLMNLKDKDGNITKHTDYHYAQ